jgi:predicted anti-sigma-YlaC factor YlaD
MSMASCREIRQALGVYVLGAIDPAERAQVDEHLATCPDCREELASLAGLPAMLRKVPVVEAERLAVADAEPDAIEMPSEQMLTSLVGRTANVRRIRRWRALAAAAAVIVVAFGGGAALGHALQSPAPAPPASRSWHTAARTDAATGADLAVKYRQTGEGTVMLVHIAGVKLGSVCQFLVTSNGTSWPTGGWQLQAWNASAWFETRTPLSESQLQSFELTVDGKVMASVHAV